MSTLIQKRSQFQKLYKIFLKTGYSAVEGTAKNQRPLIKALIREKFEKYKDCTDPSLLRELKPKGTHTFYFTHWIVTGLFGSKKHA